MRLLSVKLWVRVPPGLPILGVEQTLEALCQRAFNPRSLGDVLDIISGPE